MRFIRFRTLIACWGLVGVGLLGTPSSASIAAAPDDIVLTRGTVITVTSVSDEVNGDVVDSRKQQTGGSTVARLIARPGPDGISLREAIEATNQDPGQYTIEFAPTLAGQTIDASEELPWLEAGGLIINGDIDGDMRPDVAIRAPSTTDRPCLIVSSSDNTLHAIELVGGWGSGVSLAAATPGTTYANNTVANMVIRGARDGIGLGATGWPADSRVTEHRWVNTRIIGNQIDATFAGVGVGLAKTIGDVVEGLVISDNEIHIGGGTEQPGAAIGLGAGFWDGSSANQIIDVDIAHNTISSGGIQLGTGMVGASANLISDVRIEGNMIGDTGIVVSASDATTAWNDPDYTPVAYPDDNTIRNIEIVDNTIKWSGSGGIQIIAGSPGSRNEVTNVRVAGNDLRGHAGQPAIFVVVAEGDLASANRITALRIEDNTMQVTAADDHTVGILLTGAGHGADENELSEVYVAHNDIEGNVPGIHVRGAGDQGSARNRVSGIEILCNRIGGTGEILITGGWGPGTTGNVISDVILAGNLTGDVLNEVTSSANTDGATNNTIDWEVIDQIPEDCPIAAPNPTTSRPPTATPNEPEPTPDERGTASSELPWGWVIGTAAVLTLATSLLLLARRQTRRRPTS